MWLPLEVGQWAQSGATLARLVEPGKLKAVLRIPETQAKDITIGQPAKIDTRNGIVRGKVRRIDPAVQNGTVTVDVSLEGEMPRGARPDLSVDGTIEVERLPDVLHVGRPAYGQANSAVGLFKLTPDHEHPHGLSDRDFDSLFTTDKPIIFNFHGYPWLIHRLTYSRTNHRNLHVRGYKEKGNINTPLDLAIQNQIDRFSIAIDVIDRVPSLRVAGAHAKEKLRNMQIECQTYAYEHGVDKPDVDKWKWPA
jgi:hypothetical protein